MSLSSLLSNPLVKRLYQLWFWIFLSLAVVLGLSWYGYSEVSKELAAQEKPKVQKLNTLQSQLRFLQQQVRLYEQYGDKYQELVKKGLVKQQDRVFWTDSLIRMTDEFLIPELKFTFSAEKPLTNGQFANIKVPNGTFFFSRLRLDMSLQHEEDLIRVFESISAKISPLYLVESCQTKLNTGGEERKTSNYNFSLDNGNVTASCTLIIFHTHAKKQAERRG